MKERTSIRMTIGPHSLPPCTDARTPIAGFLFLSQAHPSLPSALTAIYHNRPGSASPPLALTRPGSCQPHLRGVFGARVMPHARRMDSAQRHSTRGFAADAPQSPVVKVALFGLGASRAASGRGLGACRASPLGSALSSARLTALHVLPGRRVLVPPAGQSKGALSRYVTNSQQPRTALVPRERPRSAPPQQGHKCHDTSPGILQEQQRPGRKAPTSQPAGKRPLSGPPHPSPPSSSSSQPLSSHVMGATLGLAPPAAWLAYRLMLRRRRGAASHTEHASHATGKALVPRI
jgi:hypothetical protein